MSETTVGKRKAVFLDRDGVIIENRDDYVKTEGEIEYIDGSLEAVKELSQTQYLIILVTNQSMVGRGLVTLETALRINGSVVRAVRQAGGRIDVSYICPHKPSDRCECRKPAPGLLLKAAMEYNVDLPSSWMIGDAESDLLAANKAGARGILVLTGRGQRELARISAHKLRFPMQVAASLQEAVKLIQTSENSTDSR